MFITIEGIDGSGKSTLAGKIADWLEDRTGQKTVCTFEPGGWEGGKTLRKFILESMGYSALSELLLFLADRSEHVSRVILPALQSKQNVICERYNDSTLAYQSGGHKLELSQVMKLISACNFPEPDAKILLDIEPETAYSRTTSHIPDKFEAEGLALMKRVSAFYLSKSEEFIVIDSTRLNEEEVLGAVIRRLEGIIECQSR